MSVLLFYSILKLLKPKMHICYENAVHIIRFILKKAFKNSVCLYSGRQPSWRNAFPNTNVSHTAASKIDKSPFCKYLQQIKNIFVTTAQVQSAKVSKYKKATPAARPLVLSYANSRWRSRHTFYTYTQYSQRTWNWINQTAISSVLACVRIQ